MDKEIKSCFILVIDNNFNHVQLIQQTLESGLRQPQVLSISSSSEALSYLQTCELEASQPRPNLVLLSLSGNENEIILAELKTGSSLKRIPVIILSDSRSESDIIKSYESYGNCYVIKTEDPQQLQRIIRRIEDFWLEIVTLPLE